MGTPLTTTDNFFDLIPNGELINYAMPNVGIERNVSGHPARARVRHGLRAVYFWLLVSSTCYARGS